jgi:hypothetical protein
MYDTEEEGKIEFLGGIITQLERRRVRPGERGGGHGTEWRLAGEGDGREKLGVLAHRTDEVFSCFLGYLTEEYLLRSKLWP